MAAPLFIDESLSENQMAVQASRLTFFEDEPYPLDVYTCALNICSLVFMYLYSSVIYGIGNIILAIAFCLVILALSIVGLIAASFMS
jgi:hypothetical protein